METSYHIEPLSLSPDTELSHAASSFMQRLVPFIHHVQDSPSEDSREEEERAVEQFYREFFSYTMAWAQVERRKFTGKSNHPDAANLKEIAKNTLDDMQDNIIRFALCYMDLHRSMGFVANELKAFEQKPEKERKVEWTSDTRTIIHRMKREKRDLISANEYLQHARQILESMSYNFETLENTLQKIYGSTQAEALIRPLRASLRVGAFDRAKKALNSIVQTRPTFALNKRKLQDMKDEIAAKGTEFINHMQHNNAALRSYDKKLYIKPQETTILIDANRYEIKKRDSYIVKYHLPFIEYQQKTLRRLRDKLVIVGSLETLMTLYIRLVRGIAEPLEDIKAVREYESKVIENVQYLLQGQFQEVGNIEKRNREVMQHLKESIEDFEAI